MFSKYNYLNKNLNYFYKKSTKISKHRYFTHGLITFNYKKTKFNEEKISKKSMNSKNFEIFLKYGSIKLMLSEDGTS